MITTQLDKAFKALLSGSYEFAFSDEHHVIAKKFKFVDAYKVSGNPDHQGKRIMAEWRHGCRTPFYHWGYIVEQKTTEAAVKRLSNSPGSEDVQRTPTP